MVVGTALMVWAKFDMTFHVRQQVWDQNIRIPVGLELFSCLPYYHLQEVILRLHVISSVLIHASVWLAVI